MKQPSSRRTIISSRSHPPDLQPRVPPHPAPLRFLQQVGGWLAAALARIPRPLAPPQSSSAAASPPSPDEILRAFAAQDAIRAAHPPRRLEGGDLQPSAESLASMTLAAMGPDAVAYHKALGEVLAMAPEYRTPSACATASLSESATRHILAAVRAMGDDGTTSPSPKGGCIRTLTAYIPFVRWDDTVPPHNVFTLADERGDPSTFFIMRFLKTAALMERSMASASARLGARFDVEIARVLSPRALEDHGWPEGPPDTWLQTTRAQMNMLFAPGLTNGIIPIVFKAADYASLTFAVEAFTVCLQGALAGSLRPVEWVGLPCPRQEILPLLEKNLFAMWTARMLDMAGKGRARAHVLVNYLASTDPVSGAERAVPSSISAEVELDRLPGDAIAVLQASSHVSGERELEMLLSPWWSPAASRMAGLSMESVVSARDIG